MKFSWVLHKVFEQAPSWEQSPSMQILAAKFFTLESKKQVLLVQQKNKWGFLGLVGLKEIPCTKKVLKFALDVDLAQL